VVGAGGGTDGAGVVGFSGSAEQGAGIGVAGVALAASGTGVLATAGFGTALFASSSGGLAGHFNGPVHVDGDVTVTGNATVTGVKSAAVPFPDGSTRKLYCMESPESWFEDFGEGHLEDGQAEIQLDSEFASIVHSNSYHVFLTEYDDNNALYVTDRTNAGFRVRAKSSKTATGKFSYRVVAKRKDIAGPRFDRVVIPAKRSPPQISVRRSKPEHQEGVKS
jgi:hypothetical protein